MFTLHRKRKTSARKKQKTPSNSLLKRQIIIGCILCLIIAVLVTSVWYTTRISSFQVKEVKVVGGFTIAHSIIEDIATQRLNGAYYTLIPKRFTFFYPKKAIEAEIVHIDRIKNARVELDSSNNLLIAFEEYKPFALWCADIDSQDCAFIDTHGYTFAKAPVLTGSAFVRYIGKDVEPVLDEQYFSQEFIDETNAFTEMLEQELALFVTHIQMFGDYDIEYSISGGGRIKVSQTMPMETSFKNLETILNSEAFMHIEPGSFQYIDLRFGDKIFVNEESIHSETGTSTATSTDEL